MNLIKRPILVYTVRSRIIDYYTRCVQCFVTGIHCAVRLVYTVLHRKETTIHGIPPPESCKENPFDSIHGAFLGVFRLLYTVQRWQRKQRCPRRRPPPCPPRSTTCGNSAVRFALPLPDFIRLPPSFPRGLLEAPASWTPKPTAR